MSLKRNMHLPLLALFMAVVTICNGQDLGSDMESWQKIFNYACGNPGIKDELMGKQFHHCYSFLETKEQELFATCQMEVFKVLLDSKNNLDQACKSAESDSLSRYIACLKTGYEKSGLDYDKAATVVNACDGRVFQLDNKIKACTGSD